MKLKYILAAFAAVALCSQASAEDGIITPDSTGFKFTDVKTIKLSPVRDQNKSGTCWCFSGNTFLEEEYLRNHDGELDLSEMFVVRKCYEDKAMKYIRMYGTINFNQGGSILDVPYVMKRYGAMPEEAYKGIKYGEEKHNHGEVAELLINYLKTVAKVPNKKLSPVWFEGYKGILDAYFGEIPETFEYKGKTYTPESYAKELGLDADDYMAFTSYTHHPFYESFPLEVADNWLWGPYMNVKLDELQAIVDNAIEKGHPVTWAADVSEKGFKWPKGYAVIPVVKEEKDMDGTELARWVKLSNKARAEEQNKITGPCEEIEVTQEKRQEMFDNQETTDDHGMVIVGTAVDQEGNKYYKVQNSWNTNQVYEGFFYVSMPYFKAKTLSILVNKNVVPKDIMNKCK